MDACGNFVKGLVSKMSEDEKKKFTVNDNNKKEVMFYDRGVYTRNRNFRYILELHYSPNAMCFDACNVSPNSFKSFNILSKN